MKGFPIVVKTLVVKSLLLMWPNIAAASEIIAIQELPEATRDSINAQYPGAVYLKAERESERGRTDYEVTICHKGLKLEIELSPQGTVSDIDHEGPC